MRHWICALGAMLAVMALLMSGAALSEADVDLSALSLDELYALRERLDGEIAVRLNAAGARYESGVYLVGRDIPAGDYVLGENADALFAGVLVRAGEDEASATLVYSPVYGQALIHLTSDTWLTLSEAWARPMAEAETVGLVDGAAREGAYLVGAQLPAGEYTAVIDERAPISSLSIYDGILGTDAALTRYELLREDTPVTLAEGDYVELSGCVLIPNE